eukprot:9500699-Pyramimonas_sp.AAC.1
MAHLTVYQGMAGDVGDVGDVGAIECADVMQELMGRINISTIRAVKRASALAPLRTQRWLLPRSMR